MTGVERFAHPFEHLVVELQLAEELRELRFSPLLPHIITPAEGRVALTLIGVAGATIIHIALLLDLADHRAAALRAFDKA